MHVAKTTRQCPNACHYSPGPKPEGQSSDRLASRPHEGVLCVLLCPAAGLLPGYSFQRNTDGWGFRLLGSPEVGPVDTEQETQ